LKAAFPALGPILSVALVVVFALAATAADATGRPGSRLDAGVFVRGSQRADVHARATDGLRRRALLAPALQAGATRGTQGEIVGALTATAAEQAHAAVATSPISCVESTVFFSGKGPATSEIAPAFSPWIFASGRALTSSEEFDRKADPSTRLGTVAIEVLPLANASVAEPANVRDIRASAGRAFSVPLDDYG